MSGLSLSNVSATRGGRTVLRDVSVAFPTGKLTAVIGPNGAGKSTMMDVAVGLLKPARGEVHIDGRPLTSFGRRALAALRAYLPQRATVDWPISVERVVALGLLPQLPAFGGLPPAFEPQIAKALEECDLLALRDRQATSLSGGELARVMLARAIVGDPDILIVDEPTAGLDPRHAIDAARRLRARADAGRSVIMAIHDLDLAARFADEVVALKDGRLLAGGPVAEVMTEARLGALYDVRVRVARDMDGLSVRFLD